MLSDSVRDAGCGCGLLGAGARDGGRGRHHEGRLHLLDVLQRGDALVVHVAPVLVVGAGVRHQLRHVDESCKY